MPEPVARRTGGGQQLLRLLAHRGARERELVDRPLVRLDDARIEARGDIGLRGAGDDGAVDRHRRAEQVGRGAIGRRQLGRLGARRRAGRRKRIGGALVDVGADVGLGGAGHDRVLLDRYRPAEAVGRGTVGGSQLGRLAPHATIKQVERVDGALIGIAAYGGANGPGDDRFGLPIGIDRPAEDVASGSVGSGQHRRLGPRRWCRTCERVDGARTGSPGSADDDPGLCDRHRPAEVVTRDGAGRGQLGGLRPFVADLREDVGGAPTIIRERRAHDGRSALHHHGMAELVARGAVGRREPPLLRHGRRHPRQPGHERPRHRKRATDATKFLHDTLLSSAPTDEGDSAEERY